MQGVISVFKEAQKFLVSVNGKPEFKDLMTVLFGWSTIFDDDIFDYTSPSYFKNTKKGRVLEVNVFNSVIGTELYYRKKEMISKINALLKKEKICEVVFLVKSPKSAIHKSANVKCSNTRKESEYTKLIKKSDLKESLDKLYGAISEKYE